MSWLNDTNHAEHLVQRAANLDGLTAEVVKELALAAIHALLAINAGLEQIWQEIRNG